MPMRSSPAFEPTTAGELRALTVPPALPDGGQGTPRAGGARAAGVVGLICEHAHLCVHGPAAALLGSADGRG